MTIDPTETRVLQHSDLESGYHTVGQFVILTVVTHSFVCLALHERCWHFEMHRIMGTELNGATVTDRINMDVKFKYG